jgi:chemotaxis signal transduction protein
MFQPVQNLEFSRLPMTAQADSEAPGKVDPDRRITVVYSSAGQRWSLPAELVGDVAPAMPAAPVPFAPFAFEGIVEVGGLPTAQVDLSEFLGGPIRTGPYAMLVRTSRGPIKVRVDSASLAASASTDETPSGLPGIEALVADLVCAECDEQPRPGAITDAADEGQLDFLVIRSGPVPVAVPALDVERVGRHSGAWNSRTGGTGERAIALEGEILPGWSLAAWLGSGQIEDETWTVVLGGEDDRVALTVAEVRGLVSVPRRRIKHAAHRTGISTWLLDSEDRAIEVIGPAGIATTGPGKTTQRLPSPVEPKLSNSNPPTSHSQIAFKAGPFTCVLPSMAVIEVRGGIERADLPARRSRAALPVFDPAVLLGFPSPSLNATRAVVLRRSGKRRPVSLLTADVGNARDGEWHPLPAVPQAIHDLFQSVRLNGPSCDLLLRETAFARSGCRAVASLLENALAGWLSGAR